MVINGEVSFRSANHLTTLREARNEIKAEKKEKYDDSALDSIIGIMSRDKQRSILCGKDTGRFLTTMPSVVNGTELSAQEF